MEKASVLFKGFVFGILSILLAAGAARGQTITGRVTAADTGEPLTGYYVHVFDPDWNTVGYAPAAGDGNYVIPDGQTTFEPLPVGVSLRVTARPPEPNLPYIEQHYNLKDPGQTPDIIVLSEGETRSGIDFALQRGPDNQVGGVVRNTAGTPIQTFNAQNLSVAIESWNINYAVTVPVDANGAYTFQYLPSADDYLVSVWVEDLNGCQGSFLYALDPNKTVGIDAPTASAIYHLQATPVPVDAATDHGKIDIIINGNQPRQISGFVAAADESPLFGYELSVWAEDIEFSGWSSSDVNGNYTFCGVPASGALVVAVEPPDAQSLYNGQFYNNKETFDAADRLSTLSGDLTGVDFFLPRAPANLVQGQVRDTAGNPLAGKHVFFYAGSIDFSKSAVTDIEGVYSMTGLEPADDYRISVYHDLDGTEYDFYYFDATRSVIVYEQATPVAVTETAELFGKDVIIGFQGGEISGTVFNADGTARISDIRVNAWSEGLQAGGEAVTDAQGSYRIWGLPSPADASGNYVVAIQSSRFVNQFYNRATTSNSATPVPTGSSGVDFFLDAGSTLSGNVFDGGTERPVSGAVVAAFSLSAGYYAETATGADGAYILSNLAPDNDYIVSVRHPDFQPEWFNGKQREEDADPVDLTRAATVVDFVLSKGAVISGTIHLDDVAGPAAAGVSVEAFSPTARIGNGADARSDGSYEIIGLNPEITDYVLTVYEPGRPVVYYNEVQPDGIVYARQWATGIAPSDGRNMVLPPGISLSGKVAFNGQPVKGIRVEATASETIPGGEVDYGWGEAISAASLVDGANYVMTGIRPGTASNPVTYRVTLYPPPELAQFAMQTIEVPVGDRNVAGVDFSLNQAPGRTLSGVVNDLAPGSVAYVSTWSEAVRSGNGVEIIGTGNPVPYAVTNLIPAADYVVELTSPDYPRHVYKNKLGWMPPDTVDLTDDNAVGIDFTLPDLSSLATISGVVTFPEGASVGATVRVEAISAATGVERETEVSLSDGGLTAAYTIPALLKADDYRVSVRSSQYRFQYYNGAATENDASLVDISGGDIGNINFTLGIGTAISGRVSGNDAGVSGVEMTAWSDSLGVGGYALSGTDGNYVIRGLERAPDYVVAASAWRSGLGVFYHGEDGTVRTEGLAARISTEAGNVPNIGIVISRGESISGMVRSTDGQGLAGIRVSAWSELRQAGNSSVTDSAGSYAIRGLPDSLYEVSAEPDWTTGFIGKTRTNVSSGSIDVNFALTRKLGSHRLSGVITDGVNGIGGVAIEFWTDDGSLAGWDVTDATGGWGIAGMATGIYRATATPPASTNLAFREQENIDISSDFSGLNIVLGPGVQITGSVRNSDGTPIRNAVVHAVSINTGYWEKTSTNTSGAFAFRNVPSAADMVLTASKTGYAPKEAVGFDPDSAVQFVLYSSGSIRGQVSDMDGAPLPDVPVVVTSAAQRRVPEFSGSARTDENGRYSIDGLRSTDAQGNPIDDYRVGSAAFTRYTDAGAPVRYLSTIQTGRRTGDTVNLSMTRATDSAVGISGGILGLSLSSDQYVAVDLVAGSGDSGRFEQHQVISGSGGFSFRGLEPGVDYFLGFGVYTGDAEMPDVYQWAGPTGPIADPDSHQPPSNASAFAAGATGIGFQFDPNLTRRRRSDIAGPGTVRNLRLDISGLTHTGDPSVLQARSTPQNLNRSPSAAVSNSPTVTVTWLPSATGADELYYYLFNQNSAHQINKRNAPMPAVTARKATSRDLSGDYNQHHFHIAAEDDRGRIGDTSTISFIIDTVAPRNVNVRASAHTAAENTSVITLALGATGATEVYISDTTFGEGGQWETYAATRQWVVSGAQDTATFYIQFRDQAHNTANALVEVDLDDSLGGAVSVLQVLTGVFAGGVDADGNGQVGLSDAILLLQEAAGIR